jgi:iron complex transport system substrate-binding protein
VTLPAEPARIVSLQPATTETLYALGGGARLVGDTNFDDYPAAAKALPHVASYQGVSIEQLVALKPDLVLAGGNGGNPAADIARLRSLGIPVIVVYAATVEAVLADIRLVGEASGLYPAALTLTDAMEARMAAISAAASAAGSRPRTFYEIDHQPEIYGPADDSFVADMVTRAGGQVITTGSSTSYTMPLERLVAADPQVIVLGDADYGTTAAQVIGRGAPWTAMSAVRDGAVRPIDDIIVTRPGPRLADGLAALALAIHPGLALPGGAGSPTPTGAASPTP